MHQRLDRGHAAACYFFDQIDDADDAFAPGDPIARRPRWWGRRCRLPRGFDLIR